MPINFQPADPFSPAISEYYGRSMQNAADAPGIAAARQRAASAGADASAQMAAINARLFESDADRQQAAIINRDRQAFEAEKFRTTLGPTARDSFMANAEADQQRNRFNLQAQLSELELTQQEKIRLQRMKNAIGTIATDPTLTDQEKADFTLQLKTGIDPMEKRNAAARIKSETAQREALIENTRMQAAIREETLKFQAQSFDDKRRVIPDARALAEITEEVKSASPGLTQEEAGERAKQLAIQRGLYHEWVMSSPGKWEAVLGRGAPGEGAGNGPAGPGGPSGSTSKGGQKDMTESQVLQQAKARVEGAGVTKDADGYADKLAKAFTDIQAEEKVKRQQKESGGKPPPVDAQAKQESLNAIAAQGNEFAARTDIDPQTKGAAIAITRQVHQWVDKYGSAQHFPEEVKRRYEQMKRFMENIPAAPAKPLDVPRPAPEAPRPSLGDRFLGALGGGGGAGGGAQR